METLPEQNRQNAPVAYTPSVYQQVVEDIHANKLRNCSFRTLMNAYGINQNQAAAIRLKLVTDGKAKFNRRHELDLL
jgi:malic enzyme